MNLFSLSETLSKRTKILPYLFSLARKKAINCLFPLSVDWQTESSSSSTLAITGVSEKRKITGSAPDLQAESLSAF